MRATPRNHRDLRAKIYVFARVIMRLSGIFIVSLVVFCFLSLRKIFPAEARVGWRQFWIGVWGKALTKLMGARLHVQGPLPKAPFFLVSNHLSYVDGILFCSLLAPRAVVKSEVREWPGIGILGKAMDVIFIRRQEKGDLLLVRDQMARAIEEGSGLFVFPEGTSSSGKTVLPFKSSIFDLAAQRQIPIHYAAIHYRVAAGNGKASEKICWWGEMTFLPHLYSLLALPGFDAFFQFCEHPIQSEDRKELARILRAAILKKFVNTDEEINERPAQAHNSTQTETTPAGSGAHFAIK